MAKRRMGANRGGARTAGAGGGGNTKGNGVGSTNRAGGDCTYAGQEYSEGAIIDQGGVQQRCVNGKWQIVDPAHRGRGGLPSNA
jgi:hypothetical protein